MTIDKTADVKPDKPEKDEAELTDEEAEKLEHVPMRRSPTVEKTGDVKEKRD